LKNFNFAINFHNAKKYEPACDVQMDSKCSSLCECSIMMYLYTSDLKLNSWRATALHSLAPTHTSCKEVSSNPEGLD